MNIACPECNTLYRVDPDRVPASGAAARCRECGTVLRVDPAEGASAPGEFVTATAVAPAAQAPEPAVAPEPAGDTGPGETVEVRPETGAAPEEDAPGAEAPVFGPQDPDTRARRLARALVSDIKVYHPEKWEEAAAAGALRNEFRDEILKSWEEYVEQVGEEMAKKTPYFRDALNEILAEGERVF